MLELTHFVVMEGVLWYVDTTRDGRPRLVVPKSLQHQLLSQVHFDLLQQRACMRNLFRGTGEEVCMGMLSSL